MFNGWKTYSGILIAATPTLAGLFGYNVSAGFDVEASENINDLILLLGSAIAIYGRLVAQSKGWFAKN